MTNLDEQLKYFINVKLTTDPLWADVDIHLSGHLVGLPSLLINELHPIYAFNEFRHLVKVNIKSWNIFDIHVLNQVMM